MHFRSIFSAIRFVYIAMAISGAILSIQFKVPGVKQSCREKRNTLISTICDACNGCLYGCMHEARIKNGTNKNQILWLQTQAVVHSTRKMYHDAVKTITF